MKRNPIAAFVMLLILSVSSFGNEDCENLQYQKKGEEVWVAYPMFRSSTDDPKMNYFYYLVLDQDGGKYIQIDVHSFDIDKFIVNDDAYVTFLGDDVRVNVPIYSTDDVLFFNMRFELKNKDAVKEIFKKCDGLIFDDNVSGEDGIYINILLDREKDIFSEFFDCSHKLAQKTTFEEAASLVTQ